METTLDVEWAHAIAPGAKIVLVATPNDNGSTVLDALLYAIQHRLGDVISLSWAAPEQNYKASLLSDLHTMFTIAASEHVTVVGATGDTGATGNKQMFPAPFYTYPVALWPATDPDVTAVGGTSLNLDAAGTRLSADTVWNDTYSLAVNKYANQGGSPPSPFASGGGKSVIFTRPSYQDSVTREVGSRRGIPDISMSASCSASVEIYHSFNFSEAGYPAGWNLVCGTSESAPVFAAIVALAVQVAGHPLGLINRPSTSWPPSMPRGSCRLSLAITPSRSSRATRRGRSTATAPMAATASPPASVRSTRRTSSPS
jgi:subtilase family serine protease